MLTIGIGLGGFLVNAFELHGSLVAYSKGDDIPVRGGSLITFSGPKYHFYGNQLTCEPITGSNLGMDYLGNILTGSSLLDVPIQLKMLKDETCVTICTPKSELEGPDYLGKHATAVGFYDSRKFPRLELIIDNLQVTGKIKENLVPLQVQKYMEKGKELTDDPRTLFVQGIPLYNPLGQLNNHWIIEVEIEPNKVYNVEGGIFGIGGTRVTTEKYTIVGVQVEFETVLNHSECSKEEGAKAPYNRVYDQNGLMKNWFYSVKYTINPNKTWAQRWKIPYGAMQCGIVFEDGLCIFQMDSQDGMLWYLLLDTGMLAFGLVLIETFIMIGILRKDLMFAEDLERGPEDDSFSWKSLKGDVFKKPEHSTILVSLVGGGLQILFAAVPPAVAQMLGVVPEVAHGQIVQIAIFSWAAAGFPSGYIVCRLYRMFGSPNWKLTVMRTSLLIPGLALFWTIIINVGVNLSAYFGFAKAPLTLNAGALIRLLCVWVFLSLPLTACGCFFGLRAPQIPFPSEPFRIPRPEPSFNISYVLLAAAAGSLVHASSISLADTLLKGLMNSISFQGHIVKILIASLEWLTVSSMSSVCLTFYLINDGCSRWWWWSYMSAASSGFWILVLMIGEMEAHVHSLPDMLVYFGLGVIVVSALALVSAAVGFLSSLAFMFFIFRRIRND